MSVDANVIAQERVTALERYQVMDTPPEAEFDQIVQLASLICETPMSMISLLDDHRQWFKSKIGLEETESPLSTSFCQYALATNSVMLVPDTLQDGRFQKNPFVTAGLNVRFYAGAPLITPDGIPVGTLCAIDRKPRQLSSFQENCLTMLAGEVMTLLERRANRKGKEWGPHDTMALRRHTNTRLTNSLRLLSAISVVIDDSIDAASMLSATLQAICRHTGWPLGRALLPGDLRAEGAPEIETWRADDSPVAAAYREFVRVTPLAATALLQQAIETHGVVERFLNLPGAELPAAPLLVRHGFKAGVSVPILGHTMLGAMEFYRRSDEATDPAFMETLANIGRLVGAAIEREDARKQTQFSETYFRHLAENSLDIVTILDADGTIRFESRSITTHLGWRPEELHGRSAFAYVHPEDLPHVGAAFQQSLRAEGPTALLCFRFRHQDGSYRYLEGRGNNLLADPAVGGIVFASRDVTEKLRLEEQFGQLAGGIAHDFNNLLTVIVGYSSIMEKDADAHPRFRNALGEVCAAANRVASLTGQLMAFSGKQILQPANLRLDDQVEKSVQALSVLLGETARLNFTPGAGDARIFVDPPQLESVLLNLALNARDAMVGLGEIRVSTRTVHAGPESELPPGDYGVIDLRDTGCGMSGETLGRIFEPYFTTKPGGKGSGLGLAACQGVIRQSKGRIIAHSEIGVGSTFSIYLPLVAAPASERVHGAPPVPATGKTQTILFVDDEEAIRDLGTFILEDAGYRVITAENGRAALDKLAAEPGRPFDLLLTDIVMPEMDGHQLAAIIRERYPATAILFCSGFTRETRQHETPPPHTFFLPKPYTISLLLDKVRTVFEKVAAGE